MSDLQENQTSVVSEVSPAPEMVVEAPQDVAESASVYTSDDARAQLQEAQERLDAIKAAQANQTVQTVEPDTTEQTFTLSTANQTDDDSYSTLLESVTNSYSDKIDSVNSSFQKYFDQSSSLAQSTINSITASFDERRTDAQEVAENAMQASNVLGARTGRLRYAPEIQRGIITGQENALITTLGELDAQEASAIAAAEAAQFDRDYETFTDQMEQISAIETQRETTLSALQTAVAEENKAREERRQQQQQELAIVEQFAGGVTDPVEVFQNLQGDVPYDLIVEYANTLPEPVSTDPVKLGRYDRLVDPVTGEVISFGGSADGGVSVTAGGSVTRVPSIGGLTKETATQSDIDSLNISQEAKNWVKTWMSGEMTLKEIMTSFGTAQNARSIKSEIAGVVNQLEKNKAVAPEDIRMAEYVNETASNMNEAIENIFRMFNVTAKDIDNFNIETGEFNEGYEPSDRFGRLRGTEAKPYIRNMFRNVSGTDAAQIQSYLDTVQALVGFDALADMRAASPTGGALGQVTEKELSLLQSVQGNIEIGQQNASLLKTLRQIHARSVLIEEDSANTVAEANSRSELDELASQESYETNSDLISRMAGEQNSDLTDEELYANIGLTD